jgi:hypothetical protein
MWILSFNAPAAEWRFNSPEHQHSMSARGSHHSNSIGLQDNLSLGKDSRLLFQCLSPKIQQTPNAAIDPPGDNYVTDKFSIKDKLIPVGSNRLLDRLLVAARKLSRFFSACRRVATTRRFLTPPISRRAHN